MPTYEYRCTACGHQEEVFAKMSDPAPELCASCGATRTLEKLLFPVAVQYKGSGFYSTDYGSSKRSASNSTGSSGDAASSEAGSSSASGGDSGGSSSGSGSASSSTDS